MKLEKIKEGMTLYEVGSYRMGNTTMRTVGVWDVKVHSVDMQTRTITASWNGNKASRMYEREWKKLRAKRPKLVDCGHGRHRLQTRAEMAKSSESEDAT